MTHICVSDLTSIASDNGLSPGRRQAIIRTNGGIIAYNNNKSLRNKLQWIFSRNSNIFIQENAFESVVCEKAAISSRPQWVNPSAIVSYDNVTIWKAFRIIGLFVMVQCGVLVFPLFFNKFYFKKQSACLWSETPCISFGAAVIMIPILLPLRHNMKSRFIRVFLHSVAG